MIHITYFYKYIQIILDGGRHTCVMRAIFVSSWVKKRLASCHSCNHLSTESVVIHVSGCVGPRQRDKPRGYKGFQNNHLQ